LHVAAHFILAKKFKKARLIFFKFKSEMIFELFSIYKNDGKKEEKLPNFYIFGFQNVAKNIQILLIICTSYIIHSHIWLNLPRENCNFEYEPKFFQKRTLAKLIYKLGKGEGAIFYFSFKFCVVVLVAIIHLLVCI